jgi:hypothetical protein
MSPLARGRDGSRDGTKSHRTQPLLNNLPVATAARGRAHTPAHPRPCDLKSRFHVALSGRPVPQHLASIIYNTVTGLRRGLDGVPDQYRRLIINSTRSGFRTRGGPSRLVCAGCVRTVYCRCDLHRLQHHVLPWADHTLCGHGLQSRDIFSDLPSHGAYITPHKEPRLKDVEITSCICPTDRHRVAVASRIQ